VGQAAAVGPALAICISSQTPTRPETQSPGQAWLGIGHDEARCVGSGLTLALHCTPPGTPRNSIPPGTLHIETNAAPTGTPAVPAPPCLLLSNSRNPVIGPGSEAWLPMAASEGQEAPLSAESHAHFPPGELTCTPHLAT